MPLRNDERPAAASFRAAGVFIAMSKVRAARVITPLTMGREYIGAILFTAAHASAAAQRSFYAASVTSRERHTKYSICQLTTP